MWERKGRKEGFPRSREPEEIGTKIATLCNRLQWNKQIMVGTTTDRKGTGSTRYMREVLIPFCTLPPQPFLQRKKLYDSLNE